MTLARVNDRRSPSTKSRTSSSSPWNPLRRVRNTGHGERWRNIPAYPPRQSDGSGGPSNSNPTAKTPSHCPTTPRFIEKVYDIIGLYPSPPESAVVYRLDEKSQMQALQRSRPAFPMIPGMPE